MHDDIKSSYARNLPKSSKCNISTKWSNKATTFLRMEMRELSCSKQKTSALKRGKQTFNIFFGKYGGVIQNWFLRDCDLFSGQKLHFCGFSIDSKNISKASNSSQVSRHFGHQIFLLCVQKIAFQYFFLSEKCVREKKKSSLTFKETK